MATIKGKWVFKNKVYFTETLEETVNFNVIDILTNSVSMQCDKMVFENNSIICWITEVYISHPVVDSGTPNQDLAIVDFGTTPQQVSDEFLKLMNKVALYTTVKGKYVVDGGGVANIPISSVTQNSPPVVYPANYTDLNGNSYVNFSCYIPMGVSSAKATVYFGIPGVSWSYYVSSYGYFNNTACKVLDFGETEQTIDYKFFYHVLRYILVPMGSENQFVDSAGLGRIVEKTTERYKSTILSAANACLPKMEVITKYNASSNIDSVSNISGDYDQLFLCLEPSASSTQIFLTAPVKHIEKGTTMQFAAPDNTMTTYFKISRSASDGTLTVENVACYNQNAASQSSKGKIQAIFGLKIGG